MVGAVVMRRLQQGEAEGEHCLLFLLQIALVVQGEEK